MLGGRSWGGARRNPIAWLLAGQLIMFTGIAAVFPVVPLYVRHRGGGAVAAAFFIAGPMIANTLVQIPAGRLVDRIGRRPVLIGARLAFAALSFGLFADQGPLWFLALLRAGQGASGGAYVPALLAAIADLTPEDQRAKRFSQLQAAELAGLLVGPAIGGALAVWRDQAIFGWSGLAVLAGLIPMAGVPETRGTSREETVAPPPGWWRSRGLIVSCVGLGSIGLVFVMYDVVWPQFLDARGNSTLVIGLSITLFALPMLILATPGGRLSDRSDRRVILGICLTVAGACAITYPALRSLPVILSVGTVEAIAFVMCEPSLYATIADHAPPSARGRAMGMGGFTHFAGATIGAAGLGSLYGVREGLPFWLGGGTLIATALACAMLIPARRRISARSDDAKPGRLLVEAVDDRDDVARADVDGAVVARKHDEFRPT
jgi:DHA1 family multidrug resistance protein-like MFS transporter